MAPKKRAPKSIDPLSTPPPEALPSSRRELSGLVSPAPGHVSDNAKGPTHVVLPIVVQFTTYLGYAILMILGNIREYYRYVFPKKNRKTKAGYAPIVRDFDDFYQRRLYYRIRDCWNRPIDSRPGRVIGVMERKSEDYNITFEITGKIIPCINLGSYNYLGFASNPPHIDAAVLDTIKRYGVGSCSPQLELGQTQILHDLEVEVAKFVGKEAAMVLGMGYATNFSSLPGLICDDTLVVSDSLNHASLVAGIRASKGKVKVFPHNDFNKLEDILCEAVIKGQPRTHRRWKRIVIVVEGVYSMEGEIIDLPTIIRLKRKYKCHLYLDEAHSIGALGVSGRGVCEHQGVDPSDVDIMMGTFTKSFGGIGGYVAATADIIHYLKCSCSGATFADALSPPIAAQTLGVMRVLNGEDGTDEGHRRIRQLADNARYFRQKLIALGLQVLGDDASPVIPIMLFNPAKMPAFSRECLKRNVAVVVVGYPATGLIESRVRICVSAANTREDLDRALQVIDEVSEDVGIRYGKRTIPPLFDA